SRPGSHLGWQAGSIMITNQPVSFQIHCCKQVYHTVTFLSLWLECIVWLVRHTTRPPPGCDTMSRTAGAFRLDRHRPLWHYGSCRCLPASIVYLLFDKR